MVAQEPELVFTLLRNALWKSDEELPSELSEQKAIRLFAVAEQQAVSGLVMDALISNNVYMPRPLVFGAIGLLEQIKQQNRIINEGAVALEGLLSSNGVNYVLVKGPAVASFYPEPLARQSGDIDYYCDDQCYKKSLELVQSQWKVRPEREGAEKHCHYDYHDVTYEGHFKLVDLFGTERNEYFQKLIDSADTASIKIGGAQIKTIPITIHVLYIFLHLYNHLMKLGVGLRQFCDLAVMLHYCREFIDVDALRGHLRILGMDRAYRACGSILVEKLGLPAEDLCCSLSSSDRKYGQKILDVVMYRGNMGHYNKRSGFSGWKHKVESLGIKVSHFVKFVPLAPGYTCGWLWHEVRRNL